MDMIELDELDQMLIEAEQEFRDDAEALDNTMFVECCYEDHYLVRQAEDHCDAERALMEQEVMVFNEELGMWIRKEDDMMLKALKDNEQQGV